MAKKTPEHHVRRRRSGPVDVSIGERVRARRLDKGLSQTGLADLIGVTFQQVQKYEKGKNRISAARLKQIAGVLGVPYSFFLGEDSASAPSFGFLNSVAALRLVKGFANIKNRTLRAAIVALVEGLGTKEDTA